MTNDNTNSNVKLTAREKLIQLQPCFSMITPAECHELATLMTETTFSAGEVIVLQNSPVDRVYIIIEGNAEVSQQQEDHGKIYNVPLAILGPDEAIGLSEKGLFSATGKRTATVTALTKINVLELSVENLNNFFDKYIHIPVTILASAEKMLRMHFIKQALSYENLSEKQMDWLVDHIEEKYYYAGDIIIKQGEVGDCCYLIYSGKVEIVQEDSQGEKHKLALLTAPTFFGEATLITGAPRNATARMLEDGELLVLKYEYLSQLMQTEEAITDRVMSVMVERAHPKQNPHVISFQRKTADGQDVVILKNPDNDKYCQIPPEGWLIWRQLNGKRALSDLQLDSSRDVVIALISKLAKDKFVELID
jgi:putative peptide zinc metalloprotease protein